MKTSSEGAREFQNRLLPIGGRASESMEFLELRDIGRGMKRELRCLLRENIRLHVSDTPEAGCRAKAFRCDIEDLIRHLVLDARDAMPAGGAVCILTGTVALDAEYARTHPEVPPGDYAMLTISGHRRRVECDKPQSPEAQSRHPQGSGPRTRRLL
jgi:hypothetical protein